jgi:Na+-driven multidrug efflux pump
MRHTLIMDSGFMWAVNIPIVAFAAYGTNLPYLWPYLLGQMTDFIKLAFAFRLLRREQWLVNLTKE